MHRSPLDRDDPRRTDGRHADLVEAVIHQLRTYVLAITSAPADAEQDAKPDAHDLEIVVGFGELIHSVTDGPIELVLVDPRRYPRNHDVPFVGAILAVVILQVLG